MKAKTRITALNKRVRPEDVFRQLGFLFLLFIVISAGMVIKGS